MFSARKESVYGKILLSVRFSPKITEWISIRLNRAFRSQVTDEISQTQLELVVFIYGVAFKRLHVSAFLHLGHHQVKNYFIYHL